MLCSVTKLRCKQITPGFGFNDKCCFLWQNTDIELVCVRLCKNVFALHFYEELWHVIFQVLIKTRVIQKNISDRNIQHKHLAAAMLCYQKQSMTGANTHWVIYEYFVGKRDTYLLYFRSFFFNKLFWIIDFCVMSCLKYNHHTLDDSIFEDELLVKYSIYLSGWYWNICFFFNLNAECDTKQNCFVSLCLCSLINYKTCFVYKVFRWTLKRINDNTVQLTILNIIFFIIKIVDAASAVAIRPYWKIWDVLCDMASGCGRRSAR